jgi:hypothetical protein
MSPAAGKIAAGLLYGRKEENEKDLMKYLYHIRKI